jgi:hypothetical protein
MAFQNTSLEFRGIKV